MSEWEFSDFASKDNLLRTVREHSDQMLALASPPAAWEAPTAVGPLAGARHHRAPRRHHRGLLRRHRRRPGRRHRRRTRSACAGMDEHVDRGCPAPSAARRRTSCWRGSRRTAPRCWRSSRASTPTQWGGFLVPHKYMGPLPAFFYPVAQLVDYAVHTWDIRQGAGGSHALDGDAADLLVPFCFIVWQSTADCADVEPFQLGVRIGGNNAGDTRVSVTRGGRRARAGRPRATCRWCSSSTPASFVLTAMGRINGGTARGDAAAGRALLQPVLPHLERAARDWRRSAPARRAAQLLPHHRRRHVADAGRVSKPQSVPAMTRCGSPTAAADPDEPVGDHLGVLDVVAGRVDHAGDQRHVVGQRPSLEAAALVGVAGVGHRDAPARRRAPRRAAAGCRRGRRRGCAGPRSCPSTRAAARRPGRCPRGRR